MLAALEMIRDVYGGAEAYVKEKCGLSDEDVRRIRQNIVHTPPQADLTGPTGQI